ncbi:MAG: DUF924 family protein [Dokdonella sp.]
MKITESLDVLDFWFNEIDPKSWWIKDAEFDRSIADRFGAVHAQAVRCELYAWRASAQGRLAEVIVLDQFSRNLYRDSPLAFANDPVALTLAQEAVGLGVDADLTAVQRSFLYLPYMHSESLRIHEIAVDLYTRNGIASNLDFEYRHKAIIERFGRYPHRNHALGRESTQEELRFLQSAESSF